jgi:serine/threonine protein kinase/tetratricopeptide (TPR) repeat protein
MPAATVSHYKILEKLGDGGMGVVYKAEDTKLRRLVALKFLPPESTTDPEAKERFVHEAQATSSLQHNNICTVHEIDETDEGQLFIVMDYYEGETLKKKIERGPLPVEEAIDQASQIAQGLAEAHRHGIIHRDVKPANILVTSSGTAKIVDFGLAKLADRTKLTRTGSTIGTVSYMSPEQIRGESVGHRTDIWSFGVTLFEMLTGHLPFRGEHVAAILYSIANEEPSSVLTHREDVPQSIRQLCQQCLEKEADARPASMDEVLLRLGKRPERLLPWTKSFRARLRASRIAIFAVLAVLIVSLLWILRPRVAETPPQESRKWSIGFLPFRDLTSMQEASDWLLVMQAMMVDRLIGAEEIAVVDPTSLNGYLRSSFADLSTAGSGGVYQAMQAAQITFAVECMVEDTGKGHIAHCTMTETDSGIVRFSHMEPLSGAADLARVATVMSEGILGFIQKSALSVEKQRDLRPWLKSRTENYEAMRAFLRASEFSYTMRPGGEQFLREAIRLDSTFISPRIWLVSRLAENGQYKDADLEYQALLRLKPLASPFEQALIAFAGACVSRDLKAQAQALEQALQYSERNNILLYVLGRIRYLLGDYAGAIEAILPATEMKWSYQPAYFLLGISYAELKEFAKASETLERSLAVKPVYPETYNVLSALALLRGDSTGCQQYVEQYRKLGTGRDSPPDAVFASLGEIHLHYGLPGSAIRYYSRAAALKPRNARYHYDLGTICYDLGLIDSAKAEFTRTLQIDSALFNAHRMLGRVYEAKGEKGEARRHYLTYLAYDSASTDAAEVRQRVAELRR